jgi:hypothetical protein
MDEGHTWSSSPQSIIAYRQRKTMLRLELQKRFEHIDDGIQDADSNRIGELEFPKSLSRR